MPLDTIRISASATVGILIMAGRVMADPVRIDSTSFRYSQDFDTLPTAQAGPEAFAWTNDVTLSGWIRTWNTSWFQGYNGDYAGAGHATSNSTGFWNLGDADSTDRAIGSSIRGDRQTAFGLAVEVGSGIAVTEMTVSYYGEQWHQGSFEGDLSFEYKVVSGSIELSRFDILTEDDWTIHSALTFHTLHVGAGMARSGNAAENRVQLSDTFAIDASAGDTIVIRWFNDNPADDDVWTAGLAIDDLTITVNGEISTDPDPDPDPGPDPDPEPTTYTLSHWHSSIASGTTKEIEMGAWGGEDQYDLAQDQPYTLMHYGGAVQTADNVSGHSLTLSVYPETKKQVVWGLGASMTDASAWVLLQLKTQNPDLYKMTMARLFCPRKGAGFSVIRLAVGASDFITGSSYYTYCDPESPDLSAFSIDRDRLHILPVLKDALALNPDIRFIGSPWSAPAWMKTNNSLFGISSDEKAAGQTNRLKPEHFGTFANYLVKFIEAYADEGITIDGISLQNEPQFDGAHYPCMRMTIDDYRSVIAEIGPRLEARGMETRILVHDHNWVLHPNDQQVIGGDAKMDPKTLVEELYETSPIAEYIGGSAWHCYSGDANDLETIYTDLKNDYPDRLILTTESTAWNSDRSRWANGDQSIVINWIWDLGWGLNHNWLATFLHGGAASLQWNFALDHNHGPSPRSDSYAYGLVTVHTDSWNEVKFEREFYAMAHLSKAMAGGGAVLHSELLNNGSPYTGCKTLAVQRDDGRIGLFVYNEHSGAAANLTVICGDQKANVRIGPSTLATLLLEEDARFSDLQKARDLDIQHSLYQDGPLSHFRYRYEHDSTIDEVDIRFSYSEDLVNWQEVAASSDGLPPVNTDEAAYGNWIHRTGGFSGDRYRDVIIEDPVGNRDKRFYKIEFLVD